MGGAPVLESSPCRFVRPLGAVGVGGYHRSPDPGGDNGGQVREDRRGGGRCAVGAGELLIPHVRNSIDTLRHIRWSKSVLNWDYGGDGAEKGFRLVLSSVQLIDLIGPPTRSRK